jgi:membrane protease subunit (stomatin/prohibitin family)
VAHRQAAKYDQQAYEQQQQQAAAQAPAPAAAPEPAEDEATAQLKNLANLHSQGILTDDEFAAAKAKVLGI